MFVFVIGAHSTQGWEDNIRHDKTWHYIKKENWEEKHIEIWGTSTSSQAWNLSGAVLEICSGSQVLNFKLLACNAVT